MEEIGVSTKNIIVDDSYHTSVSHVVIDSYRPYHPLYHSHSDHHTYMFRGATSFITPEIVEKYFIPHLDDAKIVTSEIAQVPLDSVKTLLKAAGDRKIMRFLDMDLPCSVAVGPANLGSRDDVPFESFFHCLAGDVSPQLRSAEGEVMMMRSLPCSQGDVPELFPELDAQMLLQEPPSITAERIIDRCPEAQLVAVTKGVAGAGLCVRGQEGLSIRIIPDITITDETGAGDAFLGGLIAGLYHWVSFVEMVHN